MQQEFLSSQTLPIEVQQLAEAYNLGRLIGLYPKKKPGIGGWIARFLLVLLFITAPLVVEWPMFFSYLARIPVPILLAVLGFDLVWYGIIFAVLFPWYRNRRQQGYVFAAGFLCYGGSKTVLVRWEEIETVWRGTTGDEGVSLNSLKIRKTDGQTISLGSYISDAVQFCDALEREYVARKLPGVIEQYNAGAPIAFGKLIVGQHGLSKGKEILPWHEVEKAEVNDKRVNIKRRGKRIGWFYSSVPNVPDACILRALLPYVLYGSPGRMYGAGTRGARF